MKSITEKVTEKVSLEETKSFASSSSRGAIVDGENGRPEIPSIARIVKARDARTRTVRSGNQNKPVDSVMPIKINILSARTKRCADLGLKLYLSCA